ncbi:MAG: HEAT repeat domain-containing protein [Planctomycetota bacterium]|nr:HEAT repeat domain-containing protein [Planctomycetota bacterium]
MVKINSQGTIVARAAPSVLRLAGLMLALSAIIGAAAVAADAPAGCFVRFKVEALPPGQKSLAVTAFMKIHASPWATPHFALTPKDGVAQPGLTPWVDLRTLPGKADGSLILSIPAGAQGSTQFATAPSDAAVAREIPWDDPDANRIIVAPSGTDIRTFRDQERRYYLNALGHNGDQLGPLARPPLMFSNAWGHTTGASAEYMVKTFRVLGFNSVETLTDAGKYEALYGWHSQGGQYAPPTFMPFDEDASRALYAEHYRKYFDKGGQGQAASAGMRIFQVADEPGEIAVKDLPEAQKGFRRWLAGQGVAPALFEKASWDDVSLMLAKPQTPQERRLHYWSRRYQAYLTPRMFALACGAVREQSPGKQVLSYVAISGHAMSFPSKQPLDMFQLAQYPSMIPGVSDWMTSGSWWWDSHQSVAWSVAPFNAGARQFGKTFGQPPVSFPMMHCVNPTPFRAYTQLANNCKLISYYNYGPDYEATEGFWSNVPWMHGVVGQVNNRSAIVDDILGPGVMRHSRVAMLYSAPQEVWWPQGSFADKRASFLALSHDYYQPELVTERQVLDGALEHYDALYVLDQFVSRAVQNRIEGWVKGGGLLWACADAAVNDEYAEPCDLLDRLAGLKRDHNAPQTAEAQVAPVVGEDTFPAHSVPPLGRSKETVRPGVFKWESARVRAQYSDGNPAWAEQKVGKGMLVYVGHRCGLAISRRTGKRGSFAWWPEGGRQLLSVPLIEAKVKRELALSVPFVMASAISTESGTVVVLIDMNATPAADVVVTLEERARPHSVQAFDGTALVDLPFEFADGQLRTTLKQIPSNGQMIVVRRQPAPQDDRLAKMRATAQEGLQSDDWQTLSAAAWFAGFFPDWKLAAKLVPLLKHEHWAVRRSAAESLGRLRYEAAASDVRGVIDKERDPHALADELRALVRLQHRDAQKLCVKYRASADPFIRIEAEHAEALHQATAARK